jgi:hypothetical protein
VPGSRVEFDLDDQGRVVLSKAGEGQKRRAGRLDAVRGILGGGLTTDEIMKLLGD